MRRPTFWRTHMAKAKRTDMPAGTDPMLLRMMSPKKYHAYGEIKDPTKDASIIAKAEARRERRRARNLRMEDRR